MRHQAAGDQRAQPERDGQMADPASKARTPRLALVCALLLVLIGLLILLPDTTRARCALITVTGVTLTAAVRAARIRDRLESLISLTIAVAVIGSIALTLALGPASKTAGILMLTLLVAAVPACVLSGLRDEHTVSVQTMFGAISVYLVIGTFFALLMTLAARFNSTPYFAQGTDGTLSQRVYYSYVTLATLGYGDLTPATPVGRLLAVCETVVGNLYLVTAVGLVVSRIGRPTGRAAARADEPR
jgi:hypothetical protein